VSYQALEGFRLSRQQERLWRLGSGAGRSAVTQSVVRISGVLPPGRVREILGRLVACHEMLRTVFRCLEGMELPIQVILDELEPAYRELVLDDGADGLAAVVAEERAAPFDLENGPVVRFALASLEAGEHALVITSPAVSADAVSHRNLAADLGRWLGADAGAEAAEAAEDEEVTQYVDFAEWQNQLFGEEEAEAARERWRQLLSAELLASALPIEGAPAGAAAPPERTALELPAPAEVERAAAALGVDAPGFVRAGWAALLRRYLEEPRIPLGIHHHGRKYEELALAQGPFGKVLPLVLELEVGRPFARVVESLERAAAEAEEWEEYFSFELLPERGEGGPSILPFAFEVAPAAEELDAGGVRLRFEPRGGFVDLSRLLLRVTVADGFRLELIHDPGNLAAADAERLLGQLGSLLTSAAEDPERTLAELDVLSAGERQQLLETRYDETPASAELPIPRRLAERAARVPETVAVTCDGTALSFAGLHRRVCRLARALAARGVGVESRVPVVLPRSLDQVVAVLAVLEAGAAFVPVDPAQPRRRIDAMLEEVWSDARREALLTDAGFAEELAAAGLPAVTLAELEESAGADVPEREGTAPRTPPESLAYLLFTSGSTGRPKGTMVRHRSVANLADALEERIYRGRGEVGRVSLNAPLSFDAAVKQLVQLARGRTLVIVPEEVRADGEALLATIEKERVEALDCTPSQLGLLLAAGLDRRRELPLEVVLVGGEAIAPELWERLASHRGVEYFNVYGPTECTVDTTACRIDADPEPALGPAIANAGVFVVDARLHPVPVGVAGELAIAGAGLARGYAARPRWTAERFVPDPFARVPGSRLYRSGDRVRRSAEGRLAYLGRIDQQVKLRGYRIELGEIESVLESHPAVADAVTAVREDSPGGPRLVAYVLPRRRPAASIDAPTFRLPNGLTVAHRNRNETEYLYQEIFADRCYARHGIELPEGACVFDVGANIGMFSLFVLQECRRPRIYAFEPLPPLFETLRLNRDLHGPEIRLFPFGLSEVEHVERFTFYPRYTMMSGQSAYARPEAEVEVVKRFLENQLATGVDEAAELMEEAEELLEGRFEAEVVEARLRRLSDVLLEEGVEHVDLLKIDVQRAELDVLRGIDEDDWGKIDQVVMELHDDPETESAGRVGEVTDLLEGLGFSVVVEQDELLRETDRYNLYAVRPGLERPPSPPPERSDQALDLEQLRQLLRDRLPEPMVPSAIVSVGSFPLTRHGKVDRSALPAPEQETAEAPGRPPRTPFEEVLAGIWSEVLGVGRVGADDNFFEIGGHSILATRLMARVRQLFDLDLPLRVLFEKPTVESLAERIEAALQAGEIDTAPPLEPMPRDRPLPLSFAQQRLWFLHQLEPESSAYNNPKVIRLAGELEVDVLRRAFGEVARRHEVLRTTFQAVDGEPVQRIGRPGELPMPRVDLRRLEPGSAAVEGRRLARREARRPFDLASDRPLRIAVVELADDDFLLLFTLHHVASDAWSLGVLAREVGGLYEAFRAGRPSPFPELGLQYADFAAWQRSWLSGEVLEAQLDYWRRQLEGLPALLELPTDRPRRSDGDRRGGSLTTALPAALVSELERLARARGATLFMVLLAGFQALLSRWSGATDLAVGTPVAGRRRVELEELIGFFLNTLVLRGDLRGRPSFARLVDRTREATLGAFAHQDLPFETLVDVLQPERSLHHTPLFQLFFSLQNAPAAELELPGIAVRGVEAGPVPARFDLTLVLNRRDEGLSADFQYAVELFDRTTILRFAATFERLLAGLARHPDRPISEPSLLSAVERAQVAVEWNDTGAPSPSAVGVHQLVEARAERAPEAVAVLSTTAGQLTYRRLDSASERLARRLRALGAGPEVVVGVALERTPELVVALLGILKSGAAYLPLDPGYPRERLAFQLADSDAALLVTDERSLERFPEPRPRVVLVDRDSDRDSGGDSGGGPAADSAGEPAAPVPAERLAYVIYTSGSTGRPKGVAVSHGAAVNFLRSMARRPGLEPTDTLAAVTTLSFDIALLEIFLPLLVGARSVVVDRETAADGALLARTLGAERATVMQATPATWRQLVESGWPGNRRLAALCGGEPLPRSLAERLLEAGGTVWNLYGPTETTVWSTVGRVGAGPGPVTVGRPIAETRLRLLDRELGTVPVGVVGEVFLGGSGLARGYLGRPGLTAERFLPDPLCGVPAGGRAGVRLYRVGDLGRLLPSGELEILGRVDHQVKVRGFRIEPGEVESALGGHPEVVESVVVARSDPGAVDGLGGARLVAYVVVRGAPAAAELRGFLGERLPAHMVPSAFVRLDALPRLPNGKIDRSALPAPASATLAAGVGSAPPRTPTEEILVEIWAQILGLERVGIYDDFFELGGHSLLATRAVARVRRALGVELPLRTLFETPTVAAIAGAVAGAGSDAGAEPPLLAGERPAAAPLSFSQERLWFFDQLTPGSGVYNLPLALRLAGALDPAALRWAFAEIVRRHEILRSRYTAPSGEPRQVVAPASASVPALPVVDLGALPVSRRRAEERRLAEAEAVRPFDLERGPVLRLTLLRLGAEEHTLLATLHHVAGDAWSMEVMSREVAVLYRAARSGRPSPLPELPLQYADFAIWQRRRLAGARLEAELAFWRDRLAGSRAALSLPVDRPRPAVLGYRGASHRIDLGDGAALEALARRQGATPFMAGLALFQLFLARHTGDRDVTVGTPVAGRGRVELEPLIGFFVNTLVLRLRLAGDPGFAALVAGARGVALDAFAHAELPFEKLVEALEPERTLDRDPLYEVAFGLRRAGVGGIGSPELDLPGLEPSRLATASGTAKLPLSLWLDRHEDGLRATFEYKTDLFDDTTVGRFAEHLRNLLAAAVAEPERPVSSLPLLASGERHQALVEWNDVGQDVAARDVPGAADGTVLDLVAAQVARTPEATAVVHGARQLSYGLLASVWRRVARRLRVHGVAAGEPVAVCAPRSPEQVAAVLGVLAAGGVYVPLDPSYPAARRGGVLADSGASILVATPELAAELPDHDARLLPLDRLCADAGEDGEPIEGGPGLGDPAYLIHTSGSTGRPKGVLVTHRTLRDPLFWRQRRYPLSDADAVVQGMALGFDPSISELFGALISGARLVLPPAGEALDPRRFDRLLARDRVTILQRPLPLLRELLEETALGGGRTLRWLLVGGEVLDRRFQEAFYAVSAASLENLYGPTEAPFDVTLWSCPRGEGNGDRRPNVPIGRPVAGKRVWLLDRSFRPVPIGVTGELVVGGGLLAVGYPGFAAQTAASFVPDPLSGEPGARLYRTGDLARALADGNLEFLGRDDRQVKLRGLRVELGEVESLLARHPAVAEVAVVVQESSLGKRLVAFVVPRREVGRPPEAGELRRYLGELLPTAMVPVAYGVLEQLPRSAHGKLDRRALPVLAGTVEERRIDPPRDGVEEVLVAIWTELLGRDEVGIREDFFALGGHSLLAARVVSRIREVFGIELPLRALFEAPTVAALAPRIAGAFEAGHRPRIPALGRRPEPGPAPLSFGQLRLWVLYRLEPESAAYHLPVTLRLAGELEVAALSGALAEIVRRHEILRTVFAKGEEEPVQRILPPGSPLAIVDLGGLGPAAEGAARELAEREARRPFHLEREAPLRALLLRIDDRDHLLSITLHHVASDGWSMGNLARELGALYGAARRCQPSPLAELPVQYADFAAWQRGWLRGELLEAEIAHWRRRLAGSPPLLELPTDRPRPALQTFRGRSRSFALSAARREGLLAFGRGEGATLFMTQLAAFQALLGRYARQDDVAVGTPVAGRDRAELEPLIGFFVNTLVLRARLDARPSFRELLRQLREAALDAYVHASLPFEKLVEELEPERSLSHSPIFQVMFVFQNLPALAVELDGLEVHPVGSEGGIAKFDLQLTVSERGDGLLGALEYNADLFDDTTVARFAHHLDALVGEALAAPDRPLATLPLLSPAERHQLMREWNDTGAPAPSPVGLHELFEARAERTPEAVAALSAAAGQLSYRQLDASAERLAGRLRELGAGPEVVVGVALERTPDLVVALLGILKSGAAYLPLDPSYPPERLAFQLADSRAALLVTEERSLARFPEPRPRVVLWGRDRLADGLPSPGAAAPVPAERLAYVIYTSGSTGRPKGVAVSHGAAVNFLRSMARRPGLEPADTLAAVTTLSFDIALLEIFLPLLAGARVVVVDRDTAADGALLARTLGEERVTVMQATPATWRQLVESGWRGDRRLRILCGGEALPKPLARRLLEAGAALWNLYGPTETTVWSAVGEVRPDAGPVTVGRPIAATRVQLLGRELGAVPVGVAGEVFLGGSGLARGYLGRPGLTAERFVPDPRCGGPRCGGSSQPGARLYRVGDLGRLLATGELEILGRVDHQVKVRGFRIEPGEIESALGSHPAVAESVVVARSDPGAAGSLGGARLVAYVVLHGATDAAATDLRGFLEERLPAHMRPSAYVELDALPRLPNGKIDRGSLPAPGAPAGAGIGSVPPRTPAEEILAGIWAEVLGLDRVGIHEGFFELGGHSLLATRVISRLHAALGVELPLRDLFLRPTVAGVAERVQELLASGGPPAAPAIVPRAEGEVAPLSFAQQRLWFLDQLQPGSAVYNIPLAYRLRGRLEVAALEHALGELVRRHEIFRTSYRSDDGRPVQAIAPGSSTPLPVVDLRGLGVAERRRESRRLVRAEADRPFDLARGPVLRVGLIRLEREEALLWFTLHHIAGDGWSMGIVVRELAELYRAASRGVPPELRELPVQYADFALWQRSWLRGEVLEAEMDYWRRQLAGAPELLELPTDRPRPAVQRFKSANRPFALSPELSNALRAFSRERDASLFMTLMTGLAALCERHSGQTDFCLGTPIAGRNRLETEELVGLFVNTLVVRCDVAGDPSFEELLARTRGTLIEAHGHQELPFEKLVDELQPERSLSHSPLFQVMFVFQNVPRPEIELDRLEIRALTEATPLARFDVGLVLGEEGEAITGFLSYDADLFDATTIARLAEHLRQLLTGAVADPASPVGELPLLSAGERHQLVVEVNDTAKPYSADRRLHRFFTDRAVRRPEAVALIEEAAEDGEDLTSHLTAAALAARAGALAAFLRAAGVAPERRVGVCLERSAELVAAFLGVLEAGGVYVPLDPSYPAERLAFMVEDAGAEVVLVDRSTASALAGSERRLVDVGEMAEAGVAPAPDAPQTLAGRADELAYLIFTSGSTGRPKASGVVHHSFANFLEDMIPRFGLAPEERFLHGASPSFDASIAEMALALGSGATLCIAGPEGTLPGEELVTFLRTRRVTGAALTPTVLDVLPPEEVPALGLVITMGEACSDEMVTRWSPGRRMFNAYGPSETTVNATCQRLAPGTEPSIGRPLGNLRAHLLDRRGAPVPIGVPGELHLGGVALGRGYVGRPARTAATFVPDPFAAAGDRLYSTGDRCRWLGDGRLDFLGRIDHQVKVRGFRIELGEVEAAIDALPEVRSSVATVREDLPGSRRLVAYVVADGGDAFAAGLRDRLRAKLPAQMLPSAVVALDALPLLPSGKVDRRALPAPEPAAPGTAAPGTAAPGTAAPRTAGARTLGEIWCQTLGLERVGIHDNFFDLGGDSILSIQVVARAKEAGLAFTPRQLFEHQTIAALLTVAEEVAPAGEELGPVVGPVPLGPIQRWFFASGPTAPHHFNQSVLVAARETVDPGRLARAVAALHEHHDALRARFDRGPDGWGQHFAEPGEEGLFLRVDLSRLGASAPRALETAARRVQEAFDLSRGPLARWLWLELGGDAAPRLLIVVHHLVIDGVSWRILLEDLVACYRQADGGGTPRLPARTSSVAVWHRRLAELAGSEELATERGYWLDATGGVPPLPVDDPRGDDRLATEAQVAVELDEPETRSLLQEVPAAYRTRINDVLLTALARVVAGWTGSSEVLVRLEGHGREELFPDVDLSRTVGWLTSQFPLRLSVEPGTPPGAVLKRVKETLRAVPRGGIGHGVLRYLAEDRELAERPEGELTFNYLGQLDQLLPDSSIFAPAPESTGPQQHPGERRPHRLGVSAWVAGGRLRVTWSYGREQYREATVRRLADGYLEALRGLIDHCLEPEAGGLTPSDVPLAHLEQPELDRLFGAAGNVEDVYRLSSIQLGFLLQAIEARDAGVYVEQTSGSMAGELDPETLERAWQAVVDRHSILRTGFLWEGLEDPVQVVERRVPVRLRFERWGNLDREEQAERFAELRRADREAGFDLTRPPLSRGTLVELEPGDYRFVWTYHHLIGDGWSAPVLIGELLTTYRALAAGRTPELPPARPFRDLVAWPERQDSGRGESFWRRELAGFDVPTRLPPELAPRGTEPAGPRFDDRSGRLSERTTGDLQALGRRLGVTLATLFEAAWAYLLGLYCGREDVVFGVTVSGRPSELPGVESIVGPFINTVPSRVRLGDVPVEEWLRELQTRRLERQEVEHVAFEQEWSELPAGVPLYESLFVFESFPTAAAGPAEEGGAAVSELEVRGAGSRVRTRHPLTLVIHPGRELSFYLAYDGARIESVTVERLVAQLGNLLESLGEDPSRALPELSYLSPAERHQLVREWGRPEGWPAERRAAVGEVARRAASSGAVLRVLDRRGRPVPVGLAGELHSTPGGERSAAESDATGEWARFRFDGSLELLGARGEEMTVRGLTLFPRPIEAVLESHPRVAAAVVVGVAVPGAEPVPVACVAAVGDRPPDADALRRFAGRELPAPCRPRSFVVLGELPLLPSGRPDREALREVAGRALEAAEAGGSALDEIVLGIWRQVLGLESLGRDESFLDLGGHSLVAVQLLSRLRKALGVELSLADLFAAPTVAALTPRIEAALELGGGSAAPPVERTPRGGSLPLSFAQQRLWFLDQLSPGDPSYNVAAPLRFGGELELVTLERTLTEVVRRHEILRTTFPARDGRPVQRIAPPRPVPIPLVDLRSLADPVREAELRRLARGEALRPFDLAHGPLLRCVLLRLARAEHAVLFTTHHVVSDAWSIEVLLREVGTLYRAFAAGRPSPLPELEVQYADYAAWQRQWLRGEVLEEQLRYWRRQLGQDPPKLALPHDRTRSSRPPQLGGQRLLMLSESSSRGLLELARESGTTLFMVLLAAFSAAASKISGQEDFVIGMPVAHRPQLELERLIGFFVNVLPLRLVPAGKLTFRGLLEQVRERSLGALAHQDVPLEKLVEVVSSSRQRDRSPLFSVTFGVQNTALGPVETQGMELEMLSLEQQTVRFELTVWARETPEGIGLMWTYDAALFEPATIVGMHRRLEELVTRAVAEPEATLEELRNPDPDRPAAADEGAGERQRSLRRKLMSAKPKGVRLTETKPRGPGSGNHESSRTK